MKNKKWIWILIVVVILMVGWLFVRFVVGGSEDDWIKDEKGQWVKHGAPSETPDYVIEQQEAIKCAKDLYDEVKLGGMEFNSQCLGTCEDYAVDIVHVPRSDEDNLVENQCADYRNKIVNHFIELDENGEVVKII